MGVCLSCFVDMTTIAFFSCASLVHCGFKLSFDVDIANAVQHILSGDSLLCQEVVEFSWQEFVNAKAILECPPRAGIKHGDQKINEALVS